MLLKDTEIKFLAETVGMIDPFIPAKVKSGLSYGLSSTGYDIRLSSHNAIEITGYGTENALLIDPKNSENTVKQIPLKVHTDVAGSLYFILPANGVLLGVAVERLNMPSNVMAICMTKSSYARVGVFANITPVETGWEGYLTMEIKNFNNHPVKIYANEGIAQLLFYQVQGEPENGYGDGKYQNQGNHVVLSR